MKLGGTFIIYSLKLIIILWKESQKKTIIDIHENKMVAFELRNHIEKI